MITSNTDTLLVDLKTGQEVDIDELESISAIQNIMFYKGFFYIIANKKQSRLGFFLLSVNSKRPSDERHYLISWSNKTDIANCDLAMLKEKNKVTGEIDEDIVVSYKRIGINTFNVFVINIKSFLIKYWHESYQLWESPVKGFLLDTNDFMILSKDGINMIALGEKEGRVIKDMEGKDRFIHSLGSVNYLKIEPTNHLLFACQFYDNRQIHLQEQYNDSEGNTMFDNIFKIKINEITLRELLLIQSIYACKTQSDIEKLVVIQPTPDVFFKVFLELGVKSMIPYLAFDSRSIQSLLSPEHEEFFVRNQEFPVFYKREDGRSAIDTSLDNNQIKSVNLMMDYICRY